MEHDPFLQLHAIIAVCVDHAQHHEEAVGKIEDDVDSGENYYCQGGGTLYFLADICSTLLVDYYDGVCRRGASRGSAAGQRHAFLLEVVHRKKTADNDGKQWEDKLHGDEQSDKGFVFDTPLVDYIF